MAVLEDFCITTKRDFSAPVEAKNSRLMELSVVIPCYNHGAYIDEAINSVSVIKGLSYEIIILDDGSDDPETISVLQELKNKGLNVYRHENRGLAFTRNRGIELSRGEFILPLDADNKIEADYVYKALPLLRSGEFDVVYARPFLFGELTNDRYFETKAFDIDHLAIENYIDACAIFRKQVWESTGGYDLSMPYAGQEDWEFWINAYFRGFRFRFIDEQLYHYRILKNSMIAQTSALDKGVQNRLYVFQKHAGSFMTRYADLYYRSKAYERDKKNPVRSFIKYSYLQIWKKKQAGLINDH
jgi:glycosyltransferase involved in cell wall biosynthesis